MNTFISDWFYLSIRNIKQIWRPLLALLPNFFIPLFFFTVNAASFRSVSLLPNFPADSYLNFIAPTALFTAVFFSTSNIGIELVLDIASGYFQKLTIMPIARLAIILSRLTEAAFLAIMQGGIVLILLFIIGIRVKTGFLGILAMFAMLIIFSMGWSCVGLIAALRTKNPRLVQSMFMIVFPFLYITTSQMPKEFLPKTYATLVAYNPVTYVLEGVRSLMNTGWGDPAIMQGFLVSIGVFVVMLIATLASYQKSLK
jgi:ABC-2 type transport system permease protein